MANRPELDKWLKETEWVTWEPPPAVGDAMAVSFKDGEPEVAPKVWDEDYWDRAEQFQPAPRPDPAPPVPYPMDGNDALGNAPDAEGWFYRQHRRQYAGRPVALFIADQEVPVAGAEIEWHLDVSEAIFHPADLAMFMGSFSRIGEAVVVGAELLMEWMRANVDDLLAYDERVARARQPKRRQQRICPQHGQPAGACRLCWRRRG